nr:hypothetical protein [Tanacetum cinerariifolium]
MRPFGYPVTILNTLVPLGKFDGKANEGFLVGYSVNSKAFRVFNSRIMIVQETLHINFLENKPNVAGIGPKWLFDIDTLTRFMNYQPVVAGNQPNNNAGIKEILDAGKVGKETVSAQQYVMLPLWSTGSQDPHNIDDDDVFDVKENENDVYVSTSGSDKTNNKKHDEKAKRYAKGKSCVDSPTGVYVDDIIFGSTNKELCKAFERLIKDKFQMSSMGELTFFLGLQVNQKDDEIFINQDKYVAEILRKFSFTDVKSASTFIETENPLLKDPDGKDVDVHIYRYLKGKPHLGLWYPKDSPFNMMAYSDSDYAGASLDRKSTTGAAASCCAQVLWIQNQLLDYSKELASPKQTTLGKDISHPFMQFWATATIKKVNDAVQLCALSNGKKVVIIEDVIRRDLHLDNAKGVECLPNEKIFAELARMGYEKPPPKLTFYKAFFSAQWKVGKGFSGVETPLFASMLDPSPTPQATPPASPPQEQSTSPYDSTMPFLTILMKACASLSQKVAELEQDKHTQSLEILKLKKRVKTLEKKKRLNHSGFKRLRKVGTSQRVESSTYTIVGAREDEYKQGEIEAIDADENITLVDVETQEEVAVIDAELQGRIDQDDEVNATSKGVNAAEPTVFDDEEVTMTMSQTLIEMKAEKSKLIDEKIAQRLHDEEIEKVTAKEKQEKDDMKRAQVLQKQYDDKQENIDWKAVAEQIQERHLDNIKKYKSLKKKPVSIAQARKNMIIYLKNMVGCKMEHFRGMTYEKVTPIFEREYKKVQTLFKPDKDVEKPKKKRVDEETLLQESFKKLKAVEVLGSESTQEMPSNDLKEISEEGVQNMLEIVPVFEFKVEALQVKYPIIDWEIHSEDDVLWKLQRYMHYPIRWKIYTNCGVHQVSSTTRRHDMFMLIEKDHPLSNIVMTLMLSAKLQVKEDSERARDLVMKILWRPINQRAKVWIHPPSDQDG